MQGIGGRVAAWRRHRDLSQQELANRSGVTQAIISRLERHGRDVPVRTLCRLAAALDVTPGTLLDGDPPRPDLDRHAVDAVARAMVSGRRRDLPARLRPLADACAV